MQKSTKRFCKGRSVSTRIFLLGFLIVMQCSLLHAQSYKSLSDKVQLQTGKTDAAAVVKLLQQQTTYTFIYDPEYLQQCTFAALKFPNNPLGEVLHYMDEHAPLDIELTKNHTIAVRKGNSEKPAARANGRITGKVVNSKNEPLPGVTIVANNGQGTVTNVDGVYNLALEPGVYALTFSYISFDNRKVTEVAVKEKDITPLDIIMKSSATGLKEVTITANYRKASVEGLYALQKNNAAITDGISAEQISRTPDKNLGEVLKRVSGLATMDNKYVVVRGLSERYNQAVLNGQVMPSTELNRKNFSFDIIPSNIVENVTVIKTLTPDRSAEFGGGLVEVATLDIPTSNFMNLSIGGSYNSNTTGKDFVSMPLEGKEYWGKASDHRKLFGSFDWKNKTDIVDQYTKLGSKASLISNNWGLTRFNAPLSQNYQASIGRVFPEHGGKNQFGVVAAVSYRNTMLTQDVRLSRDGFEGIDTLTNEFAGMKGKRYGLTTNLGGILGVGFRNARNRVGFQSMYMRTLDQQLILGTGSHVAQGQAMGYYDLTTQTDLWQNQLRGEHNIGNKGVKIKWLGSYLRLDRLKPDNHQNITSYIKTNADDPTEYSILHGYSNAIDKGGLRWWSRALENNYAWDASVSVPFKFSAGDVFFQNTLKTGYGGWSKDRLFYVLNGGHVIGNGEYFLPLATAFGPENNASFKFSEFGDNFHRTATLHGAFVMLDNKIGDKWRLVWGIRGEYYNMNKVNSALDSIFRKINTDRGPNSYDYSALENLEPNMRWFPSANLTYSLTREMNLRLAYAKSIIRPDLREMSFFREYDFELGGAYRGGFVRSSLLDNIDFRYEWYPGPGELLSVSLFYKKIKYPMEIYEQGGGGFELQNNKESRNYGLELEMRKSLAFTKVPVLRNITVYGNFSMLRAKVTPMDISYDLTPENPLKVVMTEKLREEEKRPQTGASNYMLNAGLYYDTRPFSLSLVYNYTSNRMVRPDVAYAFSVFERPLQALDAQLAFRFLKDKLEARVNISNLLNSYSIVYANNPGENITHPKTKDLLYQKGSFDEVNYEGRPGQTYGLTLSYKL